MVYGHFLSDHLMVYLIETTYDGDSVRREAARLLLACLKNGDTEAEVRTCLERAGPAVAAAARQIGAEVRLNIWSV
jgi:hypothetical protein